MKKQFSFFILLSGLTLLLPSARGQFLQEDPFSLDEDDLSVGGDIFNDFNEDVEEGQVIEDERFFRYGRFFTLQLALGITSFDGNRGTAYNNDPPTYGLGVTYFSDFQSAYGMGFEFSKHHMFIDQPVFGAQTSEGFGLIDVSMLRFYFSYKYYIDTANLGTAITYSNPYFIGRMEYWYVTNKFPDQPDVPDDNGGAIGLGVGFGLEFPVKLRESYIGVEFLWHSVAFHDKYTQEYRPCETVNNICTGFGYEDLTGSAYSTMVSYIINW
jgi:hypothetical protein